MGYMRNAYKILVMEDEIVPDHLADLRTVEKLLQQP